MIKVKTKNLEQQDIEKKVNKNHDLLNFNNLSKKSEHLKFYLLEPEDTDVYDSIDFKTWKFCEEDDDYEKNVETIIFKDDLYYVNENSTEINNNSSFFMKNNNIYNDNFDSDYIIIGCRIPNGLVIEINDQMTLLRGVRDMPGKDGLRSYGGIGYTKLLKSSWIEFIKGHSNWLPLLNGSIFISNNKEIWWDE